VKINVLFFGGIRERLRCSEETLEVPEAISVRRFLDELIERRPQLSSARSILRVAVNEEFAPLDRVLADGDVVALIPPVAGGSRGAGVYRVSDEPLSLDEVVSAVTSEEHGGVVTFTGVVRRQSRGKRILRLEYEAYRPMAERKLAEIAGQIEGEMAGVRVAIVHRVGTLQVGELAVVIAASAPHRAQAFEACRAAIDRLKESVPIWKKEIAEDGEEWIGLGP
jgi:molybdopterin synthase catalytic subunit